MSVAVFNIEKAGNKCGNVYWDEEKDEFEFTGAAKVLIEPHKDLVIDMISLLIVHDQLVVTCRDYRISEYCRQQSM